ncbi:MAG: hypothetical protein P1U74_06950 [Legionellaceae bacterium]|nr:hypothetical protein [Legionellaceae bacterium]
MRRALPILKRFNGASRQTGPRLFHQKNIGLIDKLPQSFLDKYKQVRVSPEIHEKLERVLADTVPHSSILRDFEQTPGFLPKLLKFTALKLASNNLSPEYYRGVRHVGEAMNQKLIQGQSDSFVKTLFSKTPSDTLGLIEIYKVPQVTKVAFSSMASSADIHMNQLVSDGVSRAGVSLSRFKTGGDLFESVDSKPLEEFVERYIDHTLLPKATDGQAQREIKSSAALVSALRQKPSQYSNIQRDPLISSLITVPRFLKGIDELPMDLSSEIESVSGAVENEEVESMVRFLYDTAVEIEETQSCQVTNIKAS